MTLLPSKSVVIIEITILIGIDTRIRFAQAIKTILSIREQSTMVSTWTEYLVLRKFEGSPTRIEVCMYEGLGLACDYYDEELEEFILPDLIDNMKVIGIDDEAVVGGELVAIDSVDPLEIDGLGLVDKRDSRIG